MNPNIYIYSLADADYFDTPENVKDLNSRFILPDVLDFSTWNVRNTGIYTTAVPKSFYIPDSGWKIHISSTPDAVDDVLSICSKICLQNKSMFKFVRSRLLFNYINAKNWPRENSGKFITIYPSDDDALIQILDLLETKLAKFPGPYILSDVKFKDGPIYLRYGSFIDIRTTDSLGRSVYGMRLRTGEITTDKRKPVFEYPDGINIPECIKDSIRRRHGDSNLNYRFISALSFSNCGGVYNATKDGGAPDGPMYIIKEARQGTAYDDSKRDSTQRLYNEYEILKRVESLRIAPAAIEMFSCGCHSFLVMEKIIDETLLDAIIRKYPLVHPDVDMELANEYVAWADNIGRELEKIVSIMHEHGVSGLDVHPSNIIISEYNKIYLIDFEYSTVGGENQIKNVGAIGFYDASIPTLIEGDWHRVQMTKLMMLMPNAQVVGIDRRKMRTLVKAAERELKASQQTIENYMGGHASVAGLPIDPMERYFVEENIDDIIRNISGHILASASPDRGDRLFPGDVNQFAMGGFGLAYGAAGVLLALNESNSIVPNELVTWLEASLDNPSFKTGGLFEGRCGVALALSRLGRSSMLRDVIENSFQSCPKNRFDIFSGMAGVGMAALEASNALESSSLANLAETVGKIITDACYRNEIYSGVYGQGFFYGASGVAMFLIRLHELNGDQNILNAARRLIDHELKRGRVMDDGAFHLINGGKYLVYLDGGAIGVGFVILEYLKYRKDKEFSLIIEKIKNSCRIPFVFQPGLFQGRSGMISFLCAVGDQQCKRAALEHFEKLSWHAIATDRGIVFPGSGLMKRSLDIATGSAGILLSLSALRNRQGLALPGLQKWRERK